MTILDSLLIYFRFYRQPCPGDWNHDLDWFLERREAPEPRPSRLKRLRADFND